MKICLLDAALIAGIVALIGRSAGAAKALIKIFSAPAAAAMLKAKGMEPAN